MRAKTFGFAGVLAELDLPTARFAWALLQFNLGLELGQMLIVAALTTLLFLLRRRPPLALAVDDVAAAGDLGPLTFLDLDTADGAEVLFDFRQQGLCCFWV